MTEVFSNVPVPSDYGVVEVAGIKPLATSQLVLQEFSRITEDPNSVEKDFVALYAGVAVAGRPYGASRKLKALMSSDTHFSAKDLSSFEKQARELVEAVEQACMKKREFDAAADLSLAVQGDSDKAHESWDIADPLGETMEEALATLAKRWRVISISGKVRFLRVPDPAMLSSQMVEIEAMTSREFILYHEDRKIYNSDKEKWENPAALFVGVAQRLSGLRFAPPPAKVGRNEYNLFRGFEVKSKQGSCEHLKHFIFHTVCRGREDLFKFVWLWLAHLVQMPGEKPQTAIVLRGSGGCGKSTFGLLLERLAAPYSMTISESEHVTGRFAGAHLSTCVVAVCTEALFAGDPKVNGKIKSLVTSQSIMAESKGLPVVQMPSCVRLFFDSNNERVVPIDGNGSERRYLVMEVNDDHMNDAKYFEPIYTELLGAGIEALAYELYHYNPAEDGLSWRDVRIAPDTIERSRMRWHSMRPIERAVVRMFEDGCVTMKTTSGQSYRYQFEDGEPIRLPQSELRAHLGASMNQHEARDGDILDIMVGLFGEFVVDENGNEHAVVKKLRGVVHCEEYVPKGEAIGDGWEMVKREKTRCFEFAPLDLLRGELATRFDRATFCGAP